MGRVLPALVPIERSIGRDNRRAARACQAAVAGQLASKSPEEIRKAWRQHGHEGTGVSEGAGDERNLEETLFACVHVCSADG
jgi:hypothetical protein